MRLTLEKYQQLEAIAKDNTLEDIDRSLFSICAMYDLTEEKLDSYKAKRVLYMADKVNKLFSKPMKFKAPKHINIYRINYAIEKITFGQYLELIYFLKNADVLNKAHYITATMAKTFINREHIDKANYFVKCEADTVIGAAIQIKSNFDVFNTVKFKALLYDSYAEMPSADSSKIAKWFSTNFGWFFSAKSVAEFEGITLEQAYKLPVTRALNDLMFLKAKGRYDYHLATKKD